MAKIDSVGSWRPDQEISRNLEEGKKEWGWGPEFMYDRFWTASAA